MIDKDNVESYESDNQKYMLELWDYTRGMLNYEESLQAVRGTSPLADGSGIEGLEMLHFPTHGRVPRYGVHALEDMPVRLAVQIYNGELEALRSPMLTSDEQLFEVIDWLEVGEEVFGVDLSDQIIEAIQELSECESKVDMLEAYGVIDGDEWYERNEALSA